MPAGQPTLSDVARLAGVSRFTAGHVLNRGRGNSRVAPETSAAVLAAAERLGYRPDHAAGLLRGKRSMTYGLLVDSAGDPLRSFLVQELDTAALAAGCRLLIGNTVVSGDSFARHLQDFADRRVDGVCCAMHRVTAAQRQALLARWPEAVFYQDDGAETATGGHLVAADLAAAARLAVGHLVGDGRQRLALVLPSRPGPAGEARRRGFVQGLADAGRTCQPAQIDQGTVEDRFFAWDRPRPDTLALVDGILDRVVGGLQADGLVVQNDYWASLVLARLRARGLRVPQDVAVVGCHNHYLGAWTDPPLTSVDLQPAVAAQRLVACLEARLRGEAWAADEGLVGPRLVVRGSSLAPGQPLQTRIDLLEHHQGDAPT